MKISLIAASIVLFATAANAENPNFGIPAETQFLGQRVDVGMASASDIEGVVSDHSMSMAAENVRPEWAGSR